MTWRQRSLPAPKDSAPHPPTHPPTTPGPRRSRAVSDARTLHQTPLHPAGLNRTVRGLLCHHVVCLLVRGGLPSQASLRRDRGFVRAGVPALEGVVREGDGVHLAEHVLRGRVLLVRRAVLYQEAAPPLPAQRLRGREGVGVGA